MQMRQGSTGFPRARPDPDWISRFRTEVASGVDTVFRRMALGRSSASRARSPAESLGHDERMDGLLRIAERHRAPEFQVPVEAFFGGAGEPGPMSLRRVSRRAGSEVLDAEWSSGYAPIAPEDDVRQRYRSRPANEVARARLFLHDSPRPVAILVHGYLGGHYLFEQRAWPLAWLFDRLGLDLALAVLPFHALRGERKRPIFPGSDPRLNVEGFRQATYDLLMLARWLRTRGQPVGVMGMSLGAYTASLLATADRSLAFAVPMIPLASIADAARDAGRLVGDPEQREAQHRAIEDAHAPVSPLARPLAIAPERVRVIAGLADRITPIAQAERLARHFGAPLCTFPGGHMLQLGRSEGFREVARMLRGLGLAAH